MFGVLPKSKVNGDSDIATILQRLGYNRVWRTWNGFEEDEKRKGGVEVWKWRGT
jgi:phosphatidylinositol glycan class B